MKVGRAGLAGIFNFPDDSPEQEEFDRQVKALQLEDRAAEAAAQGLQRQQ